MKVGSLYGKYESFHPMSEKVGLQIRELVHDGSIAGHANHRITPVVADRAIDRPAELDAKAEDYRPYHLAGELQRDCGLRAIAATERLTLDRLVDGWVIALEKGRMQGLAPLQVEKLHQFATPTVY